MKALTAFIGGLVIIFAGCSGDEEIDANIQYLGAPIISIKQTSVKFFRQSEYDPTVSLKYRLEAQQLLPYAISVRLGIQGKIIAEGEVHEIVSVQYKHKHGEGKKIHRHTDKEIHHQIQEGRSVLSANINDANAGFLLDPRGNAINVWIYYQQSDSEVAARGQVKTLTLEILEWNGLGDAPYNIGSPSKLTVKAD